MSRSRLSETVAALQIVLAQLDLARRTVAQHFPLDDAKFALLTQTDLFVTDSMIKRFENAQDIAQHQLFRLLLDAANEDVTVMTNIDVANRLHKYGALPDAKAWTDYSKHRNRLAHAYPLDVKAQISALNKTFASTEDLVAAIDSVIAWGRVQGFVT